MSAARSSTSCSSTRRPARSRSRSSPRRPTGSSTSSLPAWLGSGCRSRTSTSSSTGPRSPSTPCCRSAARESACSRPPASGTCSRSAGATGPRSTTSSTVGPQPLVPRHLRREVPERLAADGSILTRLDLDAVDRESDVLVSQGVEAIAICFLHAYANPRHEAAAAERIRERHPAVTVTASHEIATEWREYERTSTTVLNAFVQPLFAGYVARLEAGLAGVGYTRSLALMQSNGGVIGADRAVRLPIRTLESGPAGGVIGSQALARELDLRERHLRGRGRNQLRRRPDRRRPDPRADGDENRPAARSSARRSTSSRSAQGAARSRGSTTGARSRSGRGAPAPLPARPASVSAAPSRR